MRKHLVIAIFARHFLNALLFCLIQSIALIVSDELFFSIFPFFSLFFNESDVEKNGPIITHASIVQAFVSLFAAIKAVLWLRRLYIIKVKAMRFKPYIIIYSIEYIFSLT